MVIQTEDNGLLAYLKGFWVWQYLRVCGHPRAHARPGVIALFLFICCIYACDSQHRSGGGQVAAQIDGSEITVHEINARLAEFSSSDGNLSLAKREILEDLIDRKLLARQAETLKLDRDPDVMRAIQNARDVVLGDELIRRKIAGRAEPTSQEIQSFIAAHPELFSQRRIYSLVSFTIANGDSKSIPKEKLDAARSSSDLEQLLRNTGIVFETEALSLNAEQLPMELAKVLLSLGPGDVATFESGHYMELIYIQAARNEPLQGLDAEQNVRSYLINIDRQRAAEAMIESLRKASQITYLGEFRGTEEIKSALGEAVISDSAKGGVIPKPLPAHVERGVAGLLK